MPEAGFLVGLPAPVVLGLIGLLLMAESGLLIGVVLPGASTVLTLGLFARLGVVPLFAAVVTAVLATTIGSHAGFVRGQRRGQSGRGGWVDRLVERRLGPDRQERLLSLLRRRARVAVAVGQCLGVVRTLVPRLAGRAGVPYPRFALCNVPAAVLWGGGLVVLGYLAGAAYQQVEDVVGLLGLPLLVVVAVAVLAWRLVRRRRRSGGQPVRPMSPDAAPESVEVG
ncbi:DedA family protein [Goodfellowiella coeruleoviolacea]|uniref:Membrane-associated protein n=1 Tax=Goodfellowiella coeruleoviolacea TaxID=334858 RepID=A0AAE3GB73_9PSEU|nr:VTT domain-containing protein [Goodfellowiella coeruleoviolacea]MCP2164082.1 membrane-associated protein [Goodfellowiella coeruleoviolacea]